MKKLWVIAGVIILAGLAGASSAWLLHTHQQKALTVTPVTKRTTQTPTISACTAANLSAHLNTGEGGGTAGSTYTTLVVQNIGRTTCTVQGYLEVQMADGTGDSVGTAADHDSSNGNGALMTLAPTGTASATLQFVDNNYPAGTCKEGATQLQVTVPGSGSAVSTPTTMTTWCPGFSVSALTQSS